MATHIFHSGDGAITQVANGWTLDPAAPVKLLTNGVPGVAPHANTSKQIWNPLSSITEYGTQIANRWSAMDTGLHAPPVLVGLVTNMRDKANAFSSFAKDVYHEAGQMVHHGVTTLVNAIMVRLSPGMLQAIKNADAVLSGLTTQDFKDATAEEVDALMEMLKDPSTYGGLVVSLGATLVQGVPVVGQVVGGAVAVNRVMVTGEAAVQAADELKGILSTWSEPMTPEQLADARARLAKWMVGSGAAIMAGLAGKAFKIARNAKSTNKNDSSTKANSDRKNSSKTQCPCKTGFPVVIASGEKLLDETDFELGGPIPVPWRRQYRSGSLEQSPWGVGWSHPLMVQLRINAAGLVYLDEQGRHLPLPAIAAGAEHFDPLEKITLKRPAANHWIIEFKDGLEHHFEQREDSDWRLPLSGMQDRNGNHVRLQWQAAGAPTDADTFAMPRLASLVDSAGRQLLLRWKDQRLQSVELAARAGTTVLASYSYDDAGQLTASQHGETPYRQYAWRSSVLVGYRKASGQRYFADYDAEGAHGRVLRSWCADGPGDDRFAYNLRERTTWITDALGRKTGYRYSDRFDIIETIRADRTRIATPHDAKGNPRGTVDPLGRQSNQRFDGRGNLTLFTSADGASTRLEYSALDLPVRMTDALGNQWLREYDDRGNLKTSTDPLGQSTSYEYDGKGNPVVITDASGKDKRLQWDDAANLVAYTDCSGRTTRFEYDRLARLTTRIDALSQRTEYRWNTQGQLQGVREADGGEHHYQWDGEGNLLGYTDPLQAVTRYQYNALGQPTARQDAAGRWLQYEYDGAGRLTALVNENRIQTRFTYDIVDNLTDEIGFDGRHQRYVYNAAGELTHLIEAGGTVEGPGKVTRFERDAMGRLRKKQAHGTCPDEASYAYDRLGRLTAAENASAQLRFAYDPLGQLLAETQTRMEPGQVQETNWLKTRRAPAADNVQTLAHQYDVLGNRLKSTLPDGRSLHWLYYGSGHLHQIELEEADGSRQTISDIERDALHRETARSQGQLESRYEWDPMGRLKRHRASRNSAVRPAPAVRGADAAATPIERRYLWDAAGQLTGRQDSIRGRQDFRYDPTGRIRQAQGGPLGAELFAFDPAGNLLDERQQVPGQTQSQSSTQPFIADNRIRVHQDLRYDYDVHGNVVERKKGAHESAKYRWDASHQLIEAEVTRHGVTQSTAYAYDALGRRIAKTGTFGQTNYLWDGDLMLQSSRGQHSSLYVYEPQSFVPLATVQGAAASGQTQTYWYQCDQVGVPQELTDQKGNIVWAADYKAWGQATIRALGTGTDGPAPRNGPRPIWHGWEDQADHAAYLRGTKGSGRNGKGKEEPRQPIEQPFRLQGQHYDEETGLHYNRFRYYDAEIGRFVSEDPIGLAGGFNLFAFAPNAVNWIDIFGLAAEGQIGTFGGLTGTNNVWDKLDAHELIRHEALVQMGCASKNSRMKDNPSIALKRGQHDDIHYEHEVDLARQHLGISSPKNTFQFGADGKPTKQQMDVWQGALRKSGMSASQAKRLRGSANKFMKSLCCCP